MRQIIDDGQPGRPFGPVIENPVPALVQGGNQFPNMAKNKEPHDAKGNSSQTVLLGFQVVIDHY